MAIAAKLVAVGALGAWRYHREQKRAPDRDPRQIDADYEVVGPDRIAPVARPPAGRPSRGAAEPRAHTKGNGSPEVDIDPPDSM